MAYLALYRKYRPLRFDQVVGQEFVTSALKHAVAADRLAHAYLFSGPRGTGKTTTARIFARAINCLAPEGGEPCNVCANCKSILAGQWGLIEIDGASHNRVEDMRSLLDAVGHVPMAGRYNLYIIDEVHMLSNAAFNAFLKTLEEPPGHVKFILATTEPFKIPRTVHSRCQHYVFQPAPTQVTADLVLQVAREEGIAIDDLSARLVAEAGNGSLRDALSVLDRVVAYCVDRVTPEAVQALLGLGDIGAVMDLTEATLASDEAGFVEALEAMVLQGHDLAEVAKSLLQYGRVLLFLAAGVEDATLLGIPLSPEQATRARALAQQLGAEKLYVFMEAAADMSRQLKFDLDKRLGFELGLMALRRAVLGIGMERSSGVARLVGPESVRPAQAAAQPARAAEEGGSDLRALLESRKKSQTAVEAAPQAPVAATASPQLSASSPPSPHPPTPSPVLADSERRGGAGADAERGSSPREPMAIGIALPTGLVTFLRAIEAEHPAWIPLMQGLALVEKAPHHYIITPSASSPIAFAWWRDPAQQRALADEYCAAVGHDLTLEAIKAVKPATVSPATATPATASPATVSPATVSPAGASPSTGTTTAPAGGAATPSLTGLEPPPSGWKAEAAASLKELFPGTTLRED